MQLELDSFSPPKIAKWGVKLIPRHPWCGFQVMNKYLKRKYRELKMYVKNGWWGYARPAPRSGRQDAAMSEGMKLLSRRSVFRILK